MKGLVRLGSGVLAARLGQALANALAGLLVARILGPTGQGVYSLLIMLIFFGATLLNGGLGLGAVPMLRNAEITPRRILKAQVLWIVVMSIIAVGLGSIFLVGGLKARVGLADLSLLTFSAMVVGMVSLMAFEILLYDLLAMGRLHAGPVLNMIRAFLHLGLLLFLTVFSNLTLSVALVVYALSQLGAAVGVAILILRIEPGTPTTVAHSLPALVGLTFKRGWAGQISSLASVLHLRLDLMIVAWFHGPAAVGIYTIAVMAAELLWHLPNALQPLLVYSSSGNADVQYRDQTTVRAVRIGLLTTSGGALLWLLFARPIFSAVLQTEYLAAIPALMALLPGIVIFSCGSVLAGDFIGRGRPVWNAQASVLTVFVNIICGLLLIPHFGIVGAAWASSMAYFAGALLMLWRFNRISNCPLSRIFRLQR